MNITKRAFLDIYFIIEDCGKCINFNLFHNKLEFPFLYILQMAHNVPGWRRFASPNKGFARQRPRLAKCGGAKHHKWLKARLVFCGTRAAERRRSANRLLCEVLAGFYVIFFIQYVILFIRS